MSIKQMSLVWEYEFAPNEQLVMLALADHANDSGGNIYPSINRIAWKTGYSKRSVQRIIKDLRERGVLKLVEDASRYMPNRYRIVWEKATRKPPYKGRQDGMSATDRGDADGAQGVTPTSPKPSVNHHIATLEDTFSKASNIQIPEDWKFRQKLWRTPLKRMGQAAGDDTAEYIGLAVKQMRKDKLTVATPASIEKVFTDLYAKKEDKWEMPYAK